MNRCYGPDSYGMIFRAASSDFAYRYLLNCSGKARVECVMPCTRYAEEGMRRIARDPERSAGDAASPACPDTPARAAQRRGIVRALLDVVALVTPAAR